MYMDYNFLRDKYPEIITKDQLYRICHISKRKALWLLENGIIPCEDSGKKTRRFKIRLDDVIEFLELRDAGLLDEVLPVGIFSSGCGGEYEPQPRQPRTRLDSRALRAFLLDRWVDIPDVLTMPQTAALCGYSVSALERWFHNECLEGVRYRGMVLIFKESLAEWLASYKGQDIQRKSAVHKRLLEEFQIQEQGQKNSGMGFDSMSL